MSERVPQGKPGDKCVAMSLPRSLGIAFDGMIPIREMVALAKEADETGIDSIWMAEHSGYRDALGSSMAFLAATTHIKVAPITISVYLRHPMIAAMTAATLEEYAPGRTIFSIATGNPQALRESGVDAERPLRLVREYVDVVRALWSGESVTYCGQFFRLEGAQLRFDFLSSAPIYLAAMGPRMLQLAGEIADGVVLSAGLPLSYIRQAIELMRKGCQRSGRDPNSVKVAGFILTTVSPQGKSARGACKRMLAYLLRNDYIQAGFQWAGIEVKQTAVAAARRGDWAAAAELIPDEAVEQCALAGTLAECRQQLEQLWTSGLELPILLAVGDVHSRRLAVQLAGTFAQ